MATTRAHEAAATTRQGDLKAHIRRLGGEAVRERLLTGMPVTERRLELAGVSTAVLEGGDGPPVVLLHGASEFAACWMRVVPDLVRIRRVVVPDLPGHGASAVTGDPPDAGRVAAWLGQLIERACPSPPALVGHGLGGAIAPASPPTRVTGSPGWCWWTATGWAASGRRHGSRSPCSASSCDRPSAPRNASPASA
jgi:hypothetical protein